MIFGIFFVLLGLSLLLKAIFHIDIPVFRSVFALFLIYLGVHMLFGGFFRRSYTWNEKDAAMFQTKDFKWDAEADQRAYAVVFGSSTIDLTQLPEKENADPVTIHVAFGEAIVLLSKKNPFHLRVNAAFGEAITPDENMVAFGSLRYDNPEKKKSERSPLRIHGSVAFGSLKFRFKE